MYMIDGGWWFVPNLLQPATGTTIAIRKSSTESG